MAAKISGFGNSNSSLKLEARPHRSHRLSEACLQSSAVNLPVDINLLTNQRQICRDFTLPRFKKYTKTIPQQRFFHVNADLDPGKEERNSDRPPRQRSQHEDVH